MAQQQQQQQHHQQRQEIVYLGGHELGILEKLEPLGSGSFAQVYALRERGELRAGKYFPLHQLDHARMTLANRGQMLAYHEQEKQRQFRELQDEFEIMKYASSGSHYRIISPHTLYNLNDERLLLTMDLRGGSCIETLLEKKRLSTDQALATFFDVCRGLVHLHSLGVVHRDIKHGNVAWSTRGNATILDMGSAGSLAAGDTTAAHRFSGTLQFMAPEVFSFHESPFKPAWMPAVLATSKADIFSCGVMLYEMLVPGEELFPFPAQCPAGFQCKYRAGQQPGVECGCDDYIKQSICGGLTGDKFQHAFWTRDDKTRRLSNLLALMLSTEPNERPSAAAILSEGWLTNPRTTEAEPFSFSDAYRVALSGEAAGDESDRMRATPVHFRVEHRTAKGTRRYPMVGHVARRNAAAPPHYEDVRKFIERQFPRTQYANEFYEAPTTDAIVKAEGLTPLQPNGQLQKSILFVMVKR